MSWLRSIDARWMGVMLLLMLSKGLALRGESAREVVACCCSGTAETCM